MSLPKIVELPDPTRFHFGDITRDTAEEILKKEGEFLLRNYSKNPGDIVLSVRDKVEHRHYIIQNQEVKGEKVFIIGNETFKELPDLLKYYSKNPLDHVALKEPAVKCEEPSAQNRHQSNFKYLTVVQAKFDFDEGDDEDLCFKQNEILYITAKNSDKFWTARNEYGNTGKILAAYVDIVDECQSDGTTSDDEFIVLKPLPDSPVKKIDTKRRCPIQARANRSRIPNVYQKGALKFEKGDIVTITEMKVCGQWEGICNGRKGSFPFICVDIIEDS